MTSYLHSFWFCFSSPWVISSPRIFFQKNAIFTPGASTQQDVFHFDNSQNRHDSGLAQSHHHHGLLSSLAGRNTSMGLHHSWRHLQSTFLHRHTEPGICLRLTCDCHPSPGICVRFITFFCLTWNLHPVHTSIDGLTHCNLIICPQTKPHPYLNNSLGRPHQTFSCCWTYMLRPSWSGREQCRLESRSMSSSWISTLATGLTCCDFQSFGRRQRRLHGNSLRRGVIFALQCR